MIYTERHYTTPPHAAERSLPPRYCSMTFKVRDMWARFNIVAVHMPSKRCKTRGEKSCTCFHLDWSRICLVEQGVPCFLSGRGRNKHASCLTVSYLVTDCEVSSIAQTSYFLEEIDVYRNLSVNCFLAAGAFVGAET